MRMTSEWANQALSDKIPGKEAREGVEADSADSEADPGGSGILLIFLFQGASISSEVC